jgi:hypothetical protein
MANDTIVPLHSRLICLHLMSIPAPLPAKPRFLFAFQLFNTFLWVWRRIRIGVSP